MKKYLFILLVFLLIFSCKKSNGKAKNVIIVAKVNEAILTENQMKDYFSKTEWDTLSIKSKKDFINDWINLTVLQQKADELKLSDNPKIKLRIKASIKKIKANALLANEVSKISVDENEEYNYYKIHKKDFKKTIIKYALQEIFVKTKEDRDTVLVKLNNRIPFKQVAKQYSKNKYAQRGGIVDYVSKEDINPKIWRKLIKLKKYYYTTVKTDKGYYIIRYYAKKNFVKYDKFKDVKEKIKSLIIKDKKKELYRKLVDKLKAQSKILISI